MQDSLYPRDMPPWRANQHASTPWALLVSLSLIVVLSIYGISTYRRDQIVRRKLATLALLTDIKVACEQYTHDESVSLADISLDNGVVNVGAKALAPMLLSGREYLNIEVLRDCRNVKDDSDGKPMLVDSWGNPIVFVPKRSYHSAFQYRNARGRTIVVRVQESCLCQAYQLRSLGPNGSDDQGTGDDVRVLSDGQETVAPVPSMKPK